MDPKCVLMSQGKKLMGLKGQGGGRGGWGILNINSLRPWGQLILGMYHKFSNSTSQIWSQSKGLDCSVKKRSWCNCMVKQQVCWSWTCSFGTQVPQITSAIMTPMWSPSSSISFMFSSRSKAPRGVLYLMLDKKWQWLSKSLRKDLDRHKY
jgi:hypothetical protein